MADQTAAGGEPEGAEDILAGRKLQSQGATYTLISQISRGGSALVYLAAQQVAGQPKSAMVAVKIPLDKSLQGDESVRERFIKEVQVMSRINHPNVIKVYDVGYHDGMMFIATEYVPGLTLKEMISRHRPLPPDYTRDVALQICSGIGAVHALNEMYRDMKPENVISLGDLPTISAEGNPTVKIIDFGGARTDDPGAPHSTIGGKVYGSLWYMAPERLEGKDYDKRVDVYSTGAVLYELLTGQAPFPERQLNKLIVEIMSGKPTPPSVLAPNRGIPKRIDAIVLKALAKDPAQRFQTMDEFAAAIRDAYRPRKGLEALLERPKRLAIAGLGVAGVASAIIGWGIALGSGKGKAPAAAAPPTPAYGATITSSPSGAIVYIPVQDSCRVRLDSAGKTPFTDTLTADSAVYIVEFGKERQKAVVSREHDSLGFTFKPPKRNLAPKAAREDNTARRPRQR